MGMFEDVVVNARSAAEVVGKKAGQLVDISKLRLSVADVNREISRRLEALGRTVYEAKKAGYDPSDMVAESVVCIDELYEQLDAINDELAAARNKSICPVCGSVNPQEFAFCGRCGAKLVKPEPPVEEPAAEEAAETPVEEAPAEPAPEAPVEEAPTEPAADEEKPSENE